MTLLVENFATSTIADVGGIAAGDLVVNVQPGDGALFPNPSGAEFFYVVMIDTSGNREIAKCTGRSTDALTIVRAQDGTSARAFAQDDKIELRWNAAAVEFILDYFTGYFRRSKFTYKDANEVYIDGGSYEVSGTLAKITSQLTSPAFTGSGNDHHFLYIDYSAIPVGGVIDNSDLYWASDVPTFSHSKLGWYHPTNTDDRCIFIVYASAVNTIKEFFHDGGDLAKYADHIQTTPSYTDYDTAWTDLTLTAPDICDRVQVTFDHAYSDGLSQMYYRTNGQSGTTGHQGGRVHTTSVASMLTTDVFIDGSQKIEIKHDVSNGNTTLVFVNGFYLPKGM